MCHVDPCEVPCCLRLRAACELYIADSVPTQPCQKYGVFGLFQGVTPVTCYRQGCHMLRPLSSLMLSRGVKVRRDFTSERSPAESVSRRALQRVCCLLMCGRSRKSGETIVTAKDPRSSSTISKDRHPSCVRVFCSWSIVIVV